MTTKYIPAIGSSGFYSLLPPFDAMINPGERYTLQSVRTIADFVSNNEDVKGTVYVQNGIQDSYEHDVSENNEVLAIQSDKGHWLHVPIAFVKCYPLVNGIPYRALSVVIPLRPLPVNTDLSEVLSQFRDTVKSELGFDIGIDNIKVIEASRTVLVSTNTHDLATLDRALAKDPYTLAEQLALANSQIALLSTHLQQAEQFIQANL